MSLRRLGADLIMLATALPVIVHASEQPKRQPHVGPAWVAAPGPLRVSSDGRGIVDSEQRSFFYLSDTNWELFRRASREEAEELLERRRAQGFTVIFGPVTGILDALQYDRPLGLPNAYGDLPFVDGDVTRPDLTAGSDPTDAAQYDYWDHVDAILDIATTKGFHIGLIPAWHTHYTRGVVNAGNARAYGRFLGKRFGGRDNIFWVLGGDTAPAKSWSEKSLLEWTRWIARSFASTFGRTRVDVGLEVHHELAEGIRETEGARHLMSFHPIGSTSSSRWLHDADWLDFNMLQSGHSRRDIANYRMIEADYARRPVKPVIDGENRYEDHAIGDDHDVSKGWFDDYDNRQAAYWGVFAGAFGHVYGNRGVWQMLPAGAQPHLPARYDWRRAVDLPGAAAMLHMRRLMVSRPLAGRLPDQSLVVDALAGADHIQATRGDGFAFVYSAGGQSFEIVRSKLGFSAIAAWWYDPRTGVADRIGSFNSDDARLVFDPPGGPMRGNDWVLVLDDQARAFGPPGQAFANRQ